MKNIIIIITTLLLSLSINSFAQWSDGGTWIKSNDNVGIGGHTNSFSLYVRKNKGGWQGLFDNRAGAGSKVYLAHGGGYGMHIRGFTDDGKYTLELFNKTRRTNIFYNNGIVGLGLAGNVGIGTTAPTEKLHVHGNMRANVITSMSRRIKFGAHQHLSGDNNTAIYWTSNHSNTTQMILRDKENTTYGRLYGSGNGNNFGLLDGDGHWSYRAVKDAHTSFLIDNDEKMRIMDNGMVGIGTTNPQNKLHVQGAARISGRTFMGNIVDDGNLDYKLFVERGILAEKVRVAVQNTDDWADYVFEESHALAELKEVSTFIKANKHLPNVPSAAEVVEKGIDLAKMNAILLRQIEELWLHLIELDRKNDELSSKLNK